MRVIIFYIFITVLATSCINTEKPVNNSMLTPQTEFTAKQPNSEQQGNAFSISTEAYYQATIRSATSPARVISLRLTPQGRARMVTDFLDQSPLVVDSGQWNTLKNGKLSLKLQRGGQKDSIMREFKADDDKLVYIGSEYGTAGLVLWVKPIPQSKY